MTSTPPEKPDPTQDTTDYLFASPANARRLREAAEAVARAEETARLIAEEGDAAEANPDAPLQPGTRVYRGDEFIGVIDSEGNLETWAEMRARILKDIAEERRGLLDRLARYDTYGDETSDDDTEDFDSEEETREILSDPETVESLRQSEEEDERGEGVALTKDEALVYFLSGRDDLDEETTAVRDAAYARLTEDQRERLARLREKDEQ